jgi:ribosome-associated protein
MPWMQEQSLKPSKMTSDEKRDLIVKAADDKKANYLTQIDLRGKTLIADFFIVCSGTSNIHIRAVADGIVESLENAGVRAHRTEGYAEGTWIVLDYGDVIVHVMSEDERDKYKIENLWTREVKADASGQVTLSRPTTEDREDAEPAER